MSKKTYVSFTNLLDFCYFHIGSNNVVIHFQSIPLAFLNTL